MEHIVMCVGFNPTVMLWLDLSGLQGYWHAHSHAYLVGAMLFFLFLGFLPDCPTLGYLCPLFSLVRWGLPGSSACGEATESTELCLVTSGVDSSHQPLG